MQAGFAARCITPPLGVDIPGLFERRTAVGVADDLYARAVVLGTGKRLAALVQIDCIVAPQSVVNVARKRIARKTPIAAEAVMIAATHTHSGGPVGDLFSSRGSEAYCALLAEAIADAVITAYERRKSSHVGTAVNDAYGVAFNRRFRMKDGSQVTHPGKMNSAIDHPAGPADPAVTVIGFRDAKSLKPTGCIVNFGCHATHMNGTRFSADYPKWVVDTLQGVYGSEYGVVFLNAPCADVTQMDNQSPRPAEFGAYWCERTGRAVGGAAVLGLATLDYAAEGGIDVAATQVRAGIRASSAADLKAAKARVARAKQSAVDVETTFAREMLAVEALRKKSKKVTLEVQAVRIADTLLWTVPGELFQQFAHDVRAASPFPETCGVTLANGYYGYICTPEAFAGGGYEVRLARSSMLEPGTGASVADAAITLAGVLHKRALRDLKRFEASRVWPTVHDIALDGIKALEKGRRGKR